MEQLNVGILIFEDVEVLDFAGPFEVFSRTRLQAGVESRLCEESAPFRVFTVAAQEGPVTAIGNLRVIPEFSFSEAPAIDILVVPGGFGSRRLLADDRVLEWIRQVSQQAQLVTSVCTGSLVLARAGLLSGKRATTHWAAHDMLASLDKTVKVDRSARVVEDGIVTSAGVAAGIDMAFTLVSRLYGVEVAEETARYIEYPWSAASSRKSA